MQAELIEKETLNVIRFANAEVFNNPQDIAIRLAGLNKALKLGNTHHGKVKLSFKTNNNKNLKVHTTIWSVAENYIAVKANRFIPIHAITHVEF